MATASGELGGIGVSPSDYREQPANNNKKPPLIHDQKQQKSTADNVFSIDRTFSASSTDIQPSLDIFDEEDEDDSNSSGGRFRSHRRHHHHPDLNKIPGVGTGAGRKSERYVVSDATSGGGHSRAKYTNSTRADILRKEMHQRRHPQHEDCKNPKSNYNGLEDSGVACPTSKMSKVVKAPESKKREQDHRKRHNFFIDEDDSSIGVPSDISGMLRDSDVMEDEAEEMGKEANKNSMNSSEVDKAAGNNNEQRKNENGLPSRGGDGDGGDINSQKDTRSSSMKSRNSNNSILRSSIISDGRFGSINSVSSSFNSAANAAIGSGSGNYVPKIGAGIMGQNNNNDILNERLERFQRYTRGPYAPLDRCNSTSVSSAHSSTITQHYYPEGGWGYVVLATAAICHALMYGLHLTAGVFILDILGRFGENLVMSSVWLVSISMGASLLLSPLWVSICHRRSTRLTAVFGGLVTSLACLFTSFASQFHQTFISFGIILSIGVGLSRDASYLMVGQYFKRRRDFVEVFLVAASGLGILVMTLFLHIGLSGLGWRFGLQAITGAMFSTFFLSTCYRSASLYHPQRRAILHLKNQKRKIKEKGKRNDRPPFLDYSCLYSRSLQLLILSTAFTSFGSYSPLFHLALECSTMGMGTAQVIYLYLYIGAGWILGSCLFGMTVVQRNEDCRISKPYLLQGSTLIIGGALLALATFYEDHGLGSFCWIYGFGMGSYNYMLKAWTYEKTRAKNFARAWSYVQCAQGLGCILGVPATGYMNSYAGWRTGYFMSSASVFFSALITFCCGMRRRQLMRSKSGTSSMKTCETFDSSGMQSPTGRRISFTFPDEQISPRLMSKGSNRSAGSGSINAVNNSSGAGVAATITPDRQSGGSGSINSFNSANFAHYHHHQPQQQQQQQPLLIQDQPQARMPKELTCISEEGVEPHGPI